MDILRKIMILGNIALLVVAMFFLVGITIMNYSPTGMVVMGLNGDVAGKGNIDITLDTNGGISMGDMVVLIPLGMLILSISFVVVMYGISIYKKRNAIILK